MDFLSTFRADVFDLVVPPMRRKCENLRTVLFGKDESEPRLIRDSWTVHIHPNSSNTSPKPKSIHTGHIEFFSHFYFELHEEPPIKFEVPLPPSPQYPIRMRFDLHLEPYALDDALKVDEWLAFIRQSPWTAHLHKEVCLSGMRVTLGDIAALYKSQIAAGHSQRLEEIYAKSALGWNVLDFNGLATVAGTSLRVLDLTRGVCIDKKPLESGLDFRDLPILSIIIRDNLPNLRHFSFIMSGIETAEADCKEMLDSYSLEDGGTVEFLNIQLVHASCTTNIYNILRVLSRFCTSEGRVDVDVKNSEGEEIHEGQAEFVMALRKQSAERRKHLAVVDFVALGMKSLDDISELLYHEDGRVRGLWESRGLKWYEEVKTLTSKLSYLTADHRMIVKEFLQACRQFMALPQVGGRKTRERSLKELERIGDIVADNDKYHRREISTVMSDIRMRRTLNL